MVRTLKDLKLATKASLLVANNFQDYFHEIFFPESCYMLFIHLFGLSYALKTFGKLQTVETGTELKAILCKVELKLRRTVIPRTKYQKMYQAIKARTLKSIHNTLLNLRGTQGMPH